MISSDTMKEDSLNDSVHSPISKRGGVWCTPFSLIKPHGIKLSMRICVFGIGDSSVKRCPPLCSPMLIA